MQQVRFINAEMVEGRNCGNMPSSQHSSAIERQMGAGKARKAMKPCKGQQKQSLYSDVEG